MPIMPRGTSGPNACCQPDCAVGAADSAGSIKILLSMGTKT